MNLHMTGSASLKESGLVVERRRPRCAAKARSRMALQTQNIDIAHLQQMRVRRTMHRMARRASLDFHRPMLENKRPLLLGMASKANNILRRRSPHLLRPRRPMRVMAIRALNQSLVHAVMKRHFKLRLLLQVARITKLRLRFDQQKFLSLRVVHRMAGSAANIILPVQRIHRVHVLGAARMAPQTAVINFLSRMILENKNLGDVPAARYVRPAGPMTTLATLFRRATLRI